ncbi:MAG: hypothetical protein ACTSRX_02045 [Promethearchaeota archaeon]
MRLLRIQIYSSLVLRSKDEKTIVIGGITHLSEKEEIIARRSNFVGASILMFIGLILLVYGALILNEIIALSSPFIIQLDSEFLKLLQTKMDKFIFYGFFVRSYIFL